MAETDSQKNGRFKRIAQMIKLLLRVFSIPVVDLSSQKLSLSNARSPTTSQLTQLSPLKPKRQQLSLEQLAEPGARQKLNEQIGQRLKVQRSNTDSQSDCSKTVISETVRRILTDSPWTRNNEEREMARKELQCCELFRDYTPAVQRSLVRVGWYQHIESGRVITREGRPPRSFYFILSGTVKVTKRTDGGYDEVLSILKAGNSFGDSAIINNTNRTTTCVAKDPVELFVISRSDFIDLSLRQARQSYQKSKHYAFCNTVSLLKYWPISSLQSQPEVCRVCYYKPNFVIVKDSKKCDWIYILMSGSCRVVKRFVDSNSDFGTGRRYQYHSEEPKRRKPALPIHASTSGGITGSKTTIGILSHRREGHFQGESETSPRRKSLIHSHTTGNLQPRSQSFSAAIVGNETKYSCWKGIRKTGDEPLHDKPSNTQLMINPMRKQFLVQLQILQPKDIFGLSTLLHEGEPSITLLSNGAELVMISKEFILSHMTEALKVKLQRQVMQYPSEEAMRKRIRDHYTWNKYKQSMSNQIKRRL